MKKRILLIGYNFSPEPTGVGKYSGEMIQWLAKRGYSCTVVTAYPYYPFWKVQEPYKNKRLFYSTENEEFDSGGEIITLRCPMYIPSKPNGKKRIMLDFSFLISAFIRLVPLFFQRKHQYVITVSPSFQIGLLGVLYRKLKKAKHIYHIQDLQIEVAKEFMLIESPLLIRFLFSVERYIFKNADIVSSISKGMVSKIAEKCKKEVLLFRNWADTDMFFPLPNREAIKLDYGFEPKDKIFLYSGAIGEKQGLESILFTALKLKHVDNLKFVICGSGPYKNKLKELSSEMKLENVSFFPVQPTKKFNAFLNMADVHLVLQKSKASGLVMPSKITTILAIGGLALVSANKNSNLYDLIDDNNMGLLIPPEDQEALDSGVLAAFELVETSEKSLNAVRYTEKYLSLDSVMTLFESDALTVPRNSSSTSVLQE